MMNLGQQSFFLTNTVVVSIGHSRAFYVIFVPLEYITNIPPHSTYAIVICLGGNHRLRALLIFEKYETTNYDISGMRRYSRNKLQWNKNDMNSIKMTNGDFYWI